MPYYSYMDAKGDELNFCDYFQVDEDALDNYGAFNISLLSDLPLFIDPFLLFQSAKPEYQRLHDEIIRYLIFLRNRSSLAATNRGLLKEWYFFKEVEQNWFGFTFMSNKGRGLGEKFATQLRRNLQELLANRQAGGDSVVHLETVGLVDEGVGRDSISDFTTNLIKEFLLEYTQEFAKKHIDASLRSTFAVMRSRFNYDTEVWETRSFDLPKFIRDYVLLTPIDILARDDTWISKTDLVKQFDRVVESVDDEQLRARVNKYFFEKLAKEPTMAQPQRERAVADTIRRYPELLELYLRLKEAEGNKAEAESLSKVVDVKDLFIGQVRLLIRDLDSKTDFYNRPYDSYQEALTRVRAFKHYVEHQDGYKVINRRGKKFSDESEVQLFFGLVWYGSYLDINREPNNGRGPVDFKASYGRGDKVLVELKLASNSQLKRNLANQVAIYEEANETKKSIKVIIAYTPEDQARPERVLKDLELDETENVVLIDARNDNKPSASKA